MSSPLLITSDYGRIGRIAWDNTVIHPHHAVRCSFRYDPPWRTAWGWIRWQDSWAESIDPLLLASARSVDS